MDFTQFDNAALLQELTEASHCAISDDLMHNALEDAIDIKYGRTPPPWTAPTECLACHKPWHFTIPTGFSNGTQLADMTLYDLQVQSSNLRHANGDEYAARVEQECQKRGLLT